MVEKSNIPTEAKSPVTKEKTIQKAVEEKRIQQWKSKKAKSSSSFTVKQAKTQENVLSYQSICNDENLDDMQKYITQQATSCAATGSANREYSMHMVNQVANGFFENLFKAEGNADAIYNMTIETLLSLNPKDEIEGMLCSRLLVLHDQYMHFLNRVSSTGQTTAGIDTNINRATKLMRLYNETLEALNRHRRKGQQNITVQHVNVSEGGKAIIGNVSGRGANVKK